MIRIYPLITQGMRLLLERYFREVALTGVENVPTSGGGVVVSWHPNGMIDPGLIQAYFPRPIVFGARHGLFRWPGLGHLIRAMGAVPIYRAEDAPLADPSARRAANAASLQRLVQAIAQGQFTCLFPEGDSHDAPDLLSLKTGAARLLRLAHHAAPPGAPPPILLPVGLHYDRKQSWGSNVLIAIHPPLVLATPPPPPDAPAEVQQVWDDQTTEVIRQALHEAIHATESWALHYQLHRLRTLLRAEHARRAGVVLRAPRISERTLGYARTWTAHRRLRQEQPDALDDLLTRADAYEQGLHDLRLRDEDLDRSPALLAPGVAVATLLQVGLVFVLLPPLIVLGVLIHAPPALLLWLTSYAFARHQKDLASIRILLGALLFPVLWLALAIFAAQIHQTLRAMEPSLPDAPVLVGISAVGLSIVGLLVALAYVRIARETARSLQVRLTRLQRRLAVAHLRVERAEIYDQFRALTAHLDLPGAVRPDGVVVEEETHQQLPDWTP